MYTQFTSHPAIVLFLQAYIGPPSLNARYAILRSSVQELGRAGIVDSHEASSLLPYEQVVDSCGGSLSTSSQPSIALLEAANACNGLSGRALRKLPFLAHANADHLPLGCSCTKFLAALCDAAASEQQDRANMAGT